MTTIDFATRREQLRERYIRPRAQRPSSTARGVHHMALICSDIERTIEFYQDVLGFPLIELMENRDYKGSSHLFFDIGNNNLLAFFDFPGLGLETAIEAIGGVQHIAISRSQYGKREIPRQFRVMCAEPLRASGLLSVRADAARAGRDARRLVLDQQ